MGGPDQISGTVKILTCLLPLNKYTNLQSSSVHSVKMVVMWLSGDLFKTCYFIVKAAPVQFWVCGMLQISIDSAILLQVYKYGTQERTHLR